MTNTEIPKTIPCTKEETEKIYALFDSKEYKERRRLAFSGLYILETITKQELEHNA